MSNLSMLYENLKHLDGKNTPRINTFDAHPIVQAAARRDAMACMWKEISDSGQVFYFNSLTGERRERKPQQLLDLQPPVICDNCDKAHAAVECQVGQVP